MHRIQDDIHPLTAQLRDPAAEADFRASVLGDMQQDSRLAMVLAAGITGMFLISDYNFVGLSAAFYKLAAVRAVMIAGCLILAASLHSSTAVLSRPWLANAGPVLIATGTILIFYLRPHTISTLLTAVVVIVLAFYLFVPNRLSGMIGSSLYLSVGILFVAAVWGDAGFTRVITFALLLVMANIVGYFAARRLARLDRQNFLLLREERLAGQRLEREVERRELLESQLRIAAQVDELTTLSNRRHFMASAQVALQSRDHADQSFSVCMIDVDHFKTINDRWGHAGGDRVLRAIAEECRSALRGTDLIGRFGGEEFVAALPGQDREAARRVAERLRQRVAALRFGGDMDPLRTTATIGVAEVRPGERDIGPALNRADAALYDGKRGGRNRVVLAPAAPGDAVRLRR